MNKELYNHPQSIEGLHQVSKQLSSFFKTQKSCGCQCFSPKNSKCLGEIERNCDYEENLFKKYAHQTFQQKEMNFNQFFDILIQLIEDQVFVLKRSLIEIQNLRSLKIKVIQTDLQELLHLLQNSQSIQITINQNLENCLLNLTYLSQQRAIQLQNFSLSDAQQYKFQQKLPGFKNIEQHNMIIQKECCEAIAIHKDNSHVIAGCSTKIKIFKLSKNQLVEAQQLQKHTQTVNFLVFMNYERHFVSAGKDSIICIWMIGREKWEHLQTIQCWEEKISCLAISSDNKYLVSGHLEGQFRIKFFQKLYHKWCFAFHFVIQGKVQNISFNDSSDTLVVTSDEELSIILNLNDSWDQVKSVQKQKQSNDGNFLFVYDFFKEYGGKGQYFKIKQIELNHLQQIPLRYIKSKQVVISRTNDALNLMKETLDNSFALIDRIIQKLRLGEICQISHDGKYMISWNDETKAFEVQKPW